LNDTKFLKLAVKLARKGLGYTEPNPMVGAVVVKDGKIISTGYHKKFGNIHAERMALEKIKEEDTTLYVSLEPCSHFGKTPPCTDIIIEKKVKKVVIASIDTNPRISNKGIEILKENGIEISVGHLDNMNKELNSHYFKSMKYSRPYITLKAGVSIDGKLTDKYNNSQWMTGEFLREFSHNFRGEFSSIMVGYNTVIEDNPNLKLNKKNWKDKKLVRVILDSKNKLSADKFDKLNIYKETDMFPTYIFSDISYKTDKINKKATKHFYVKSSEKGLDIIDILDTLYKNNIASILVEGGGKLISTFLKEKLFDEIILFTERKIIGGKDSVELFIDGTRLDKPVNFSSSKIIETDNGYIFRGIR